MSTSAMFVVISQLPDYRERVIGQATNERRIRKAVYIGRVKTFEELDELIVRQRVLTCLVPLQPEPHLVGRWIAKSHSAGICRVIYSNDGLSKPVWDRDQISVDRTFALNAAYEEIRSGNWWLPPWAVTIDGREFYAQVKAPTRVREVTTGAVRCRWVESGVQPKLSMLLETNE